MRSLITLAATAALSVGAAAQATPLQLSTGFMPTFFNTIVDTTAMFDLTVNDPAGITLFNLGHNMNLAAGQTTSCDVWIVNMADAGGMVPTFLGNELNMAYWDVAMDGPEFSSTITTAGANLPSPGPVNGGFFLPAGDYAMAVTYNDGFPLYTAFSGANGSFSTPELDFNGGSVAAGLFAGGLFGGPGARVC